MADAVKRDNLDWGHVSGNIRLMRQLQRMTQAELAENSGLAVATLYNAEKGHRLSMRTLKKIASGLNCPVTTVCHGHWSVKEKDRAFVLHRASDTVSSPLGDKRPHVRPEDRIALRDPAEQRRVGSLGFVVGFMHMVSFLMPNGPGVISLDLYQHLEGNINETVYKDALLICVEGEAKVGVRDESVVLSAGDVIGICPKDITFMEPGPGMTAETLPVRLMWIGANRLGKIPQTARRRGRPASRKS